MVDIMLLEHQGRALRNYREAYALYVWKLTFFKKTIQVKFMTNDKLDNNFNDYELNIGSDKLGIKIMKTILEDAWEEVLNNLKICKNMGIEINQPFNNPIDIFTDTNTWMNMDNRVLNGFLGIPEYMIFNETGIIKTGTFVDITYQGSVLQIDTETLEKLPHEFNMVWRIQDRFLNKIDLWENKRIYDEEEKRVSKAYKERGYHGTDNKL